MNLGDFTPILDFNTFTLILCWFYQGHIKICFHQSYLVELRAFILELIDIQMICVLPWAEKQKAGNVQVIGHSQDSVSETNFLICKASSYQFQWA